MRVSTNNDTNLVAIKERGGVSVKIIMIPIWLQLRRGEEYQCK